MWSQTASYLQAGADACKTRAIPSQLPVDRLLRDWATVTASKYVSTDATGSFRRPLVGRFRSAAASYSGAKQNPVEKLGQLFISERAPCPRVADHH